MSPASKEELTAKTVAELKTSLKELGLPVSGKKEELVERLLAAQSTSTEAAPDSAPAATDADAAAEKPTTADAPAASADAAQESEAPAAPEAAAQAAPAVATGGRPKIVFDESAIKAMPAKITVVKSEASAAEPAKPVKSHAEKIKERAEKFKDPTVEAAKKRAERFGVFNADLERDKSKKRAERFGTFNPDLDEERKNKRAERFGIEDPVAKIAARAERFKPLGGGGASGDAAGTAAADAGQSVAEFEVAKKARAARFGIAT